MLQAIRLDGPRRVIREDVADPSLLGTGEHGATIVAERHRVGQLGLRLPAARGQPRREGGHPLRASSTYVGRQCSVKMTFEISDESGELSQKLAVHVSWVCEMDV